METTVLSNDSMLMVKDLETKVVSTEDGIELYVRVPIIWEDQEEDGDIDATQLIMVGHIKDVSNLRTEEGSKTNGEPAISYEVALVEDLSTTNAIILQVASDQTFLVDCNELWACPHARVMIVQYELFCFAATGSWSPRVTTTLEFQLLVSQLQHDAGSLLAGPSEVKQLAVWWWLYLREKVRIRVQINMWLAKMCMAFRRYLAVSQSKTLFRTQMTLMRACPELPKLSLLRDDLAGAGVVCQFAVRKGSSLSDLILGYVVRMQDGVQKFFSSDSPGFKRVCDSDENFKRMVQDYIFWHEFSSGKHPSQLLGLLVQEAIDVERRDLICGRFWSGVGRRCLFSMQATCLFKDKQGFLRPAITSKQVDDDQWEVVTRCLKLKLLHGFQMLPFDAALCDTVAVTRPVPQQALTRRAFNAKANVLVVVEQVDMREKCSLVPAYLSAEFFDEHEIVANAELQLFDDRVLAIDYLVFEMDSTFIGCRFGEVVGRLHSFPMPISPATALRSEDLVDGASQLLAASQLMQGLNSSQQVRLQQLLAEGSRSAAPVAPAIRIEEEQQVQLRENSQLTTVVV